MNLTYAFVTFMYIFIGFCDFMWLGLRAPEQVTEVRSFWAD
jgi:hypothetical protein